MTLLDNEFKHPDCYCHQCTWLKASQFERAFIPKPDAFQKQEKVDQTPIAKDWFCTVCGEKPSCKCEKPTPTPEKCTPDKCAHHALDGSWCMCSCHKPKDVVSSSSQVEKSVNKLVWEWAGSNVGMKQRLETQLRDLVRLARETK